MLKTIGKLALTSAIVGLFGSVTVAQAQLTVGPGEQTGTVGQSVDFAFSISGDSAATVSLFGFDLEFDQTTAPYAPVLVSGTNDTVNCTFDTDLMNTGLSSLTFLLPGASVGPIIGVSFGSTSFPPHAIGRGGVIAHCGFTISADATPGDVPLVCRPGSANASDAEGNPIDTTCPDGVLHILPPPPTATKTPTLPPTATATSTPPSTLTPTKPPATLTPVATHTPSPRPTSAIQDDDGCQINANGSGKGSGWLLLIPAAVLFSTRRRRR